MKPSKPIACDLDTSPPAIERCEERLALSASLGAEFLLDLVAANSALDTATQNDSPVIDETASLAEQANQFRNATGIDGSGQTVAVIDSGVAYDHVNFRGGGIRDAGIGPGYRVVGGWDFAENDANPYDDGPAGFHGTHVTSLLAGQSSSLSGLSQEGIAPGSDIVALRVFDDAGAGQLEWIESALQWVIDNQDTFESPITTVNLSVGAALTDANRMFAMDLLEDELQMLREDGILVFAAAGNFFDAADSDPSELLYPASSPSVIPVSSVDSFGNLSSFAQRNDGIWAAPGEAVVGGVPDHVFGFDGQIDDFATLSGTSMATPQLAGISILVRQALIQEGIEATPEAILARMESLSSLHTDEVSGLTFRTISLSDFLPVTQDDANDSETLTTTETSSVLNSYLGTNDGESLQLDLRDGLNLRVGDQTYSLSPSVADATIIIDVTGGDDDLQIFGSENSERLILHANDFGESVLTSGDLTIKLRGFETVQFIGGGGADRATLFDSAGDDTLHSQPTHATLEGVGFRFDVQQVDRIFVHAVNGGNDVAFLQDGQGDDHLAVRPQFTSLRSIADQRANDTFQLAYGFDRVHAFADQAGFDSIEINDSAGDDTLSISDARSVIAGPGYNVTASGFESTVASATSGGNDVARIFTTADTDDDSLADGSLSDHWDIQNDRIQWTGQDNAVRIARGFARNEAFENFQPIDLSTQALSSLPLLANASDQDDDERLTDADISRNVFSQFGEDA